MNFAEMSDMELMDEIEKACAENDEHLKKQLIAASKEESRIPAFVFEMLYEIIDYDLNFIIEILKNASEREKKALLDDVMDPEGLEELFREYENPKDLTLEYIVQGRGEDTLWMVNTGEAPDDLSRAYLERCLLTIAYHLGFEEEIKHFFETEKRKL